MAPRHRPPLELPPPAYPLQRHPQAQLPRQLIKLLQLLQRRVPAVPSVPALRLQRYGVLAFLEWQLAL